jgi:SPOR domain
LTIAGGSAAVTFTSKALAHVHRISGGIPRLINLICDRALLAGYSVRTDRITPELVKHAADSLDLAQPIASRFGWIRRRASLLAGAAVVLLASALAAGGTAFVYQRLVARTVQASADAMPIQPAPSAPQIVPAAGVVDEHRLPATARYTLLTGSFPATNAASAAQVEALTEWLQAGGFAVYYVEVDLGARGRWQRVLAGAYTDLQSARADQERLRDQGADAHVVGAEAAAGLIGSAPETTSTGAHGT